MLLPSGTVSRTVPVMPLILVLVLSIGGVFAPPQTAAGADGGPWGYELGRTRPPQQANFCDSREVALEVAQVFERFGARTGFAALANAPGCSVRVRGLTPRALLHQVRVALQNGDSYVVNFIDVQTDDGGSSVLVTTRTLDGAGAR